MKRFTDFFIERPVLAIVISLLLFLIGLRAVFSMQVRQYPKLENTVITVTTSYPGASAALVEGFVTSPLEKAIAGSDGIDYLTSSSTNGVSTISAYIKLNFDPEHAFTGIMSKVSEVEGTLPKSVLKPTIQKSTGQTTALMYLSFSSNKMSGEQITDYLQRVVQPKLETIPGVAEAKMLGPKYFAMRIWLDPDRMASLGVSPNDVTQALTQNNFQSAAGSTEGEYVAMPVNVDTDVQTPSGFGDLVIKHQNNALVRLRDVARIELGSQSYNSSVTFNGQRAVFISIQSTPTANPLTVIDSVKKTLPSIEQQYPPILKSSIVYDATRYIRASINEVTKTIIEAAIIVFIVIYLFLGSLRTVLIPMVTIPLSLVATFGVMSMMGYSINLLTLLALVLAIGLVVDDAIVVVENCYRHIEHGESPMKAALNGAREIAMPVVAMTITLAAVYAPIGFMTGITGALFTEFAFTLAASVIISGIIALTLSPMMCSRLLCSESGKTKLVHYIDGLFDRFRTRYQKRLAVIVSRPGVIVLFSFVVLSSCFFLYVSSNAEMAPQEDQGFVMVIGSGPETATLKYMEKYTRQFERVYGQFKSKANDFVVNGFAGVSSVMSGFIMKPWSERHQSAQKANQAIQKALGDIPGIQVQSFLPPALPVGGRGFPIEFYITTTQSYPNLYKVEQDMLVAAQRSGMFLFINGSLKYNKTQINLHVNRSMAAQMGISMSSLAGTMATSLGGGYVNNFNMQGRGYKVIPQLDNQFRNNVHDLSFIHLNTATGQLVPLSAITSVGSENQPNALTHFQQLNSATLQGVMMPGYTIQQGLTYLQALADKTMPAGFSYSYGGQSRQYVEEGDSLVYTFIFSILVIYLVLAAQFENFRDPLVVMISVPMAICGALLPINWGLATVNIYTQIGLITLIGLISKHGILMVELAKQQRQRYPEKSAVELITTAASIRLRPVLMTTAAIVLGVMPLLFATGAGAHSRFDIGLVISAGMVIGTLFTIFVVPTIYTLRTKTILLLLIFVGLVSPLIYSIYDTVMHVLK